MGESLSVDQIRVRDRLQSGMWYRGYGDLVPLAESAPAQWHGDDRISLYAKHILDWMCRREHIFDSVEPRTLGCLLMTTSVFDADAAFLAESYTLEALNELRLAGYLSGPTLSEWEANKASASWVLVWTKNTTPPTLVLEESGQMS